MDLYGAVVRIADGGIVGRAMQQVRTMISHQRCRRCHCHQPSTLGATDVRRKHAHYLITETLITIVSVRSLALAG